MFTHLDKFTGQLFHFETTTPAKTPIIIKTVELQLAGRVIRLWNQTFLRNPTQTPLWYSSEVHEHSVYVPTHTHATLCRYVSTHQHSWLPHTHCTSVIAIVHLAYTYPTIFLTTQLLLHSCHVPHPISC